MPIAGSHPMGIHLVDDDDHVVQRLRGLAWQEAGLVWAGHSASCAACLAALDALPAGLLLVDLGLPDGSGLEVLREAANRRPDVHRVALTVHRDSVHVLQALQAGADAYLLKDSSDDELLVRLQEVREGGSPISPKVALHVLRALRGDPGTAPPAADGVSASAALPRAPTRLHEPAPALSARETLMLQLSAKGYTHAEVAQMMGVSPNTVLTYARRCYRKLQVGSRCEAIYEARQWGLLPD